LLVRGMAAHLYRGMFRKERYDVNISQNNQKASDRKVMEIAKKIMDKRKKLFEKLAKN
jgi:hypothetical protein